MESEYCTKHPHQSRWLQKKIQEREESNLKLERQEQVKAETARKKYKAATRHERAKRLEDIPAHEDTLLNRLLDAWEEKEYGIKHQR